MRDFLKEADKNIVAIAREWEDASSFCTALQNFGNKACHEHIAKNKFFKGLAMVQDAIRHEQAEALATCFTFVGTAGEEATRLSKEKFRKVFSKDDRQLVMHFLTAHGQLPHGYSDTDDKEFRAQAKKVTKVWEDDK